MLFIAANYLALSFEYMDRSYGVSEEYFLSLGEYQLPLGTQFSLTTAAIALLFIIGSYFYSRAGLKSGADIARQAGGVLITDALIEEYTEKGDPRLRLYREVVEEIALAAILQPPELYVIPSFDVGLNAFVAGRGRDNAVLVVTEQALSLERPLLEALIAHELEHIRSQDVTFNWHSIPILAAFMMMTSFGFLLLRNLRHFQPSASRGKDRNGGIILILAIAIFAIVIGYIAYIIGRFIQSRISIKREYNADINSVVAQRRALPMIELLEKLKRGEIEARPIAGLRRECAHFLFVSEKFELIGFRTHPTLEQRIEALKPYLTIHERAEYEAKRR